MSAALLLSLAFPAEVPETCADPPREACIRSLVSSHRQTLEASSSHCRERDDTCMHEALQPALAALGVHRPAARAKATAIFNELPRFHDTTGEPLNAAAKRLVEGRLVEGGPPQDAEAPVARASYPLSPSSGRGAGDASEVPRVRIAPGTWKYVLLQAEDWRGRRALLVRNQADRSYHAEMADGARTELSASGLKALHVLGGGRIAHDAAARTISVYGYSKTYGRCSPCNQLAAELIRAAPAYRHFAVTWSNEGY
eukprot:Transcript_7977.p1 GENE.Transcript_7977~~Transcript_7977.p1  ORF type:complete len:293 (+),score=60.85 Transcript_7977:115-879(+)